MEALSLSQHDSVPQRLRGIEELMPGELRRLSLHGMGEAQLVQFRERLRAAGYAADAAEGRVTVSRRGAEGKGGAA